MTKIGTALLLFQIPSEHENLNISNPSSRKEYTGPEQLYTLFYIYNIRLSQLVISVATALYMSIQDIIIS
ncbi:Neuromedin-U receptor [Trichinella spiralis]|uniref:Neuromedin-U receptor n=1 Tax=Trichinella spiralis TaxID=6334 RepID=A0ABR3K6L5_TRISP